jgi:hypothetical protein
MQEDAMNFVRQEFGDAFDRYETKLRTWFIAYGIGAPILLLTQSTLRDRFLQSPNRRCVGILFLIGIAFQVVESWLYKMTTWYQYRGEVKNEITKSRMYKVSKWIEDHYSVDVIFDALTFILFLIATLKVFPIVMGKP